MRPVGWISAGGLVGDDELHVLLRREPLHLEVDEEDHRRCDGNDGESLLNLLPGFGVLGRDNGSEVVYLLGHDESFRLMGLIKTHVFSARELFDLANPESEQCHLNSWLIYLFYYLLI